MHWWNTKRLHEALDYAILQVVETKCYLTQPILQVVETKCYLTQPINTGA
ncbi:transposase IS3520 [Corynebacterium glutamicum MT]|nr:transposase IS3520 [Corynebacterium glutamicum MT]